MVGFTEFAASIGLTELQLLIGAIGFVALIIVMIYNAMRIKKSDRRDLDIETAKAVEPTLMSDSVSGEPEQKIEPQISSDHAHTPTPQSKIDTLIDCVFAIKLSDPVDGQRILSELNQFPRHVSYTWLIEGLVVGSNTSQNDWVSIEPGSSYQELQLAAQLANRKGPISVSDLSDFSSQCKRLADTFDGDIDFPPINEIIDEAKSLDDFAASVDIQVGITVSPSTSYTAIALKKNCDQLGLTLTRDGKSYVCKVGQQTIYNLFVGDFNFLINDLDQELKGPISLFFDLPKVSPTLRPFQRMTSDAQTLAKQYQGVVVDDSGQLLSPESMEMIASQVDSLYKKMDEYGILSGSSVAHRLFS